ncbi:MAG: hypothetical protein ACJAWA_001380 [Nonlabens sp.]|jgi:hypothetical protein
MLTVQIFYNLEVYRQANHFFLVQIIDLLKQLAPVGVFRPLPVVTEKETANNIVGI